MWVAGCSAWSNARKRNPCRSKATTLSASSHKLSPERRRWLLKFVDSKHEIISSPYRSMHVRMLSSSCGQTSTQSCRLGHCLCVRHFRILPNFLSTGRLAQPPTTRKNSKTSAQHTGGQDRRYQHNVHPGPIPDEVPGSTVRRNCRESKAVGGWKGSCWRTSSRRTRCTHQHCVSSSWTPACGRCN